MKNLLCALSILTVCTASNLSQINVFESLTILSNHSAELRFKTEESNNETKNKTLDTILKTIVNVKDLQRIVNILYEDPPDMFNFTHPLVSLQQEDNESKELNTKYLKNEESLPRNEEKISIGRTKRNLNYLEKNYRLQTRSETLAFLVRHIKDVIKSALSEALPELSKSYMYRSQNQLRMIDEISSVLSQTLDLLTYGLGKKVIILSKGIAGPENEVESKLNELYLEAKVIYEEMYNSKFFQNSQNMQELESSSSIFDGLSGIRNRKEKRKDSTGKPLLKDEEIDQEEGLAKAESMPGNEGLYQNQEHKDHLNEEILKEAEVTEENVENVDEDSNNLKHPFPQVYDNSSVSKRPSKNATDLYINATNADGIPKDLKGSLTEVHGLPNLVKKKFDVTETQGKEIITDVLKTKNANFERNNSLPELPEKEMKDFPGILDRREEESMTNSSGDYVAPSQRGLFEDLDMKSDDTENRNSRELREEESKNAMDAILEAIDEVISPSNGKNETLRYKKPVLTKDKFFEKVLKDESV